MNIDMNIIPSGDITSYAKSNQIDGIRYINNTYRLYKDIEWNNINNDTYIVLIDEEIFDGKGYKITVNYCTDTYYRYSYGLFKINASNKSVKIKNIIVYSDVTGINSDYNNGSIVRGNNNNFKIYNCKHYGLVNDYCGGIVGELCYNFKVIKCYNKGDLFVGAGGICGSFTGGSNLRLTNDYKSNILIYKCILKFIIKSCYIGGICGNYMTSFSNTNIDDYNIKSNIKIKKCNVKLKIDKNNNENDNIECYGGIFGPLSTCSYSNNYNITINILIENCIIDGDICGIYSGNVSTNLACYNNGYTKANIIIKDCVTYADINGKYSGGILGSNISHNDNIGKILIKNTFHIGNKNYDNTSGIICTNINGIVFIQNCYSIGYIANNSYGIAGNCSENAILTINNSYSNGKYEDYSFGISNSGAIINNCYSSEHKNINGVKSISRIKCKLDKLPHKEWKSVKKSYPILKNFLKYPWKNYKKNNSNIKLCVHI